MAEEPDFSSLSQETQARVSFYATVGQGITTCAHMEGILIELATLLLTAPAQKTGAVFYSIPNFHAWLNIIDELFEIESRAKLHKPHWNAISEKLRGLNDKRVALAHHALP